MFRLSWSVHDHPCLSCVDLFFFRICLSSFLYLSVYVQKHTTWFAEAMVLLAVDSVLPRVRFSKSQIMIALCMVFSSLLALGVS